jgi:hypothetical protein
MTRLNISETYLTKKYNPQINLFTVPLFAAKKNTRHLVQKVKIPIHNEPKFVAKFISKL